MSLIQHDTFPPPDSITEYVECFRTFHSTTSETIRVRVCPSGFPGIAFQHYRGNSALGNIITPSQHDTHPPTIFLYGQVTTLSEMHFTPPYTALQVVFKPQALWSLFGLDASSLNNKSLQAADFGALSLNAQLMSASSDEERVVMCSKFLQDKLSGARRDRQITHALELIEQTIGVVTVQDLQKQAGLSARQLERRFKQVVGLTPHFYIRIRRINAALKLMNSKRYERLIDIAHMLNFHDQSHFIHDMKKFSGLMPRNITQRVDEFYQDQGGSSYILF